MKKNLPKPGIPDIIVFVNKSIKLLSFNIALFYENNEKLTLLLKEINPDIICLQEVTRKVDSSALDSFISKDAIDKATQELNHSFYAPNWALRDFKQSNFHGREIYEHDFKGVLECGNYIKSKFKINEGRSIFIQKHFSYITDWEREGKHPGEEPRMVQVADVQISGTQKLRILNYHGIWSENKQDTSRTKDASYKLTQLALEVKYPSIICGDFNLFPDTESIKVLQEDFISLVDKFKIMNTRPKSNELNHLKRNVVDCIFVSREIEVKKFAVLDSDVSDHLPLLLEFEME